MPEEFSKAFWEERYGHATHGGMPPNPHLTTAAGDLTPGTALDAGCGEGAEALWLAAHGWRVTAVDIAGNALRRAREYAEAHDAAAASRIDWRQADLTGWTPPAEHFDLVCTHYVHPAGSRESLIDRLANAVAPGGTLLIVGHDPSDQHSREHGSGPQVHFTAQEVAADLDPRRWDIAVAETRTRQANAQLTLNDTVLQARKRR